VRFFFAVYCCFVARRSHLCRATAHGIVEVHGSLCFPVVIVARLTE
jgi:hypothetical protein